MIRIGTVALVVAGACAPWTTAQAWSAPWHEAIGRIADTHLTVRGRALVADLLRDEATPSLEAVATWADEVKSSATRRWHFVNLPLTCEFDPARDCEGGRCLIAALTAQTHTLRDTSQPRTERAQALRFLTHLVGDAAQPMHNYATQAGKGGNALQLRFHGASTNLHRLWDRDLLGQRWASGNDLVKHLEAHPPKGTSITLDAVAWSQSACRDAVVFELAEPGTAVSIDYERRATDVAEKAVWTAGLRLATLINTLAQ